jgi:hypothetical protein
VFSDVQSLVIKNSAIFNCDDDYIENGGAPASVTFDYCATDDGEGTNSVSPSGGSWTNEFSDPGNGDFTLLNTGNLYGAGVGPGTDASVPAADIDGDSRSGSTCDIGVDEYVAASGTDELTATDLTAGIPQLEPATVGQVHILVSVDLASNAPVLATPDIGQAHALTAGDATAGTPALGSPTIATIINGTVTVDGQLKSGAYVDVLNHSTGVVVEQTTTDVNGEYTLSLDPGTYRVAWTWYDSVGGQWYGKSSVIEVQ